LFLNKTNEAGTNSYHFAHTRTDQDHSWSIRATLSKALS